MYVVHYSLNAWGKCGIRPIDIEGVIPLDLFDRFPIVVRTKVVDGK